jgi:hypothetical protein
MGKSRTHGRRGIAVNLHPLANNDALRALLQVRLGDVRTLVGAMKTKGRRK